MSKAALYTVVGRLEEVSGGVRQEGNGWKGHCPAHSDQNASLSVAEGDDGRVLLYCHGGCETQAVVAELGLSMADLFDGSARAAKVPPVWRTTARYEYTNASGQHVATKVRREQWAGSERLAKEMPWEIPDGRPGLGGLRIADLPLYGLQGMQSAPDDKLVLLVEGEKACDATIEAGFVAVSLAGGAAQRDFGNALEALRGRTVFLWPDNDEPGRALMGRVATALEGMAAEVRWLEVPGLPQKGDAFDFLAEGGSADELRRLMAGAPSAHKAANKNERVPTSAIGALSGGDSPYPKGLVRLSDVRPEQVRWLWPARIPLGKLTIIDGDPGLGKSTVTLDIAARVSKGQPMPDGTRGDLSGPAGVILLSAEDGLADTIVPRLQAAGADLSRIDALPSVPDRNGGERLPNIPGDLLELESDIARVGAQLVVIDPLMAYLGPDVNSFRDQDVRRALAPLAQMAERTGVAVVIVRHLNKMAGSNPLYRGGGSIGIIGAARSGLLVARDPDDPAGTGCVLASVKCNIAKLPPSLKFHVEQVAEGVGQIKWGGHSPRGAAALLAAPDSNRKATAFDRAADLLTDVLAGGPMPAERVLDLAKGRGVSEHTLERAKSRLGVRSQRVGTVGAGGHWEWKLPDAALSFGARPNQHDEPPKAANPPLRPPITQIGALSPIGGLSNGVVNDHTRPQYRRLVLAPAQPFGGVAA